MSSGWCSRRLSVTLLAVMGLTLLTLFPGAAPAFADPPGRVARISLVDGQVSFRPADLDEWSDAARNYPLTTGDRVSTGRNGRTELDLGGALVRLGASTEISIQNLDDRAIELRLTGGTMDIRVRDLDPGDSVDVETPNGRMSARQPGTYRIDVNGDRSTITVRLGTADVIAANGSFPLRPQQSLVLTGLGAPRVQPRAAIAIDDFESWCIALDRQMNGSPSARYVPPDLIGISDLDNYGTWSTSLDYGPVWTPRVGAEWVPYRDGRWVWIDPWGWTWVDAAPWGFAPFHYGRWVSLRSGWGWVPGRYVARPVYAPALVAFVGGAGWDVSLSLGRGPVSWFPLGPREAYVPSYRVSANYVHAVNLPHVNVTSVNVGAIRYVNRDVPGAVTAVSHDTFVRAQPVARAAIAVPRERLQNATVVGHTAPVAQPQQASRPAYSPGPQQPTQPQGRPVPSRGRPAPEAAPAPPPPPPPAAPQARPKDEPQRQAPQARPEEKRQPPPERPTGRRAPPPPPPPPDKDKK
jgi:hypothetical protein